MMQDWIVLAERLDRLQSAEGKPSLKQFETIRRLVVGVMDEADRSQSETSLSAKKTGLARPFKAHRGRGIENVREDRFGVAARPAGGRVAAGLFRSRA
jgi:hypothetical protein